MIEELLVWLVSVPLGLLILYLLWHLAGVVERIVERNRRRSKRGKK